MKYYVNSVEQIYGKGKGIYSEYSKSTKYDDYSSALTAYYKRLSDVSAAIGSTHAYMNIVVATSTGVMQKYDSVGSYVDYSDSTSTDEIVDYSGSTSTDEGTDDVNDENVDESKIE